MLFLIIIRVFRYTKLDFVGLRYFKMIFAGGSQILPVLRNTLVLGGLIIAAMPIPVVFAILLSQMKSVRLSKVTQTISTLPYFISFILLYAVCFALFSVDDGMINVLLLKLKLISEPYDLLADANVAWITQTCLHLFKNTGYGAIVYIAAISSIDTELYDAADVDGANRFQEIWNITIPGILPTFFVMLLFSIAGILTASGFDQYYVFKNPLVVGKIDVIDTYTYNIGIKGNSYAFATAIGMTKSLVSIVLLFAANALSKLVRGTGVI